jgi:hypothetical protein
VQHHQVRIKGSSCRNLRPDVDIVWSGLGYQHGLLCRATWTSALQLWNQPKYTASNLENPLRIKFCTPASISTESVTL